MTTREQSKFGWQKGDTNSKPKPRRKRRPGAPDFSKRKPKIVLKSKKEV